MLSNPNETPDDGVLGVDVVQGTGNVTIDPYLFAHARTVAIYRDEAGIDALLRPALIQADDVAASDDLRQKIV